MEDLKKFVRENLTAIQCIRSYGEAFGLSRVASSADAVIEYALEIPVEYRHADWSKIENIGYYREMARIAIERIVLNFGVTSKIHPGFANETVVYTIKHLSSIL